MAAFYSDRPTQIALAMAASLVSLLFLAWFLGGLGQSMRMAERPGSWRTTVGMGGGFAALALLAAGFALNAAGALRAGEVTIPAETAAVFYDGGLALAGLAAPVALAALLSSVAWVSLQSAALPQWFGWVTAILALLGVITPLSFLLALVFPVWVLVASWVLRHPAATVTTGA